MLTGLSWPFVLLEDRLTPGVPAWLYADPVSIIRCDSAAEAISSCGRIESALARGLHAAGFLSYELGYALEPRLAPLMPERRAVPLFWFGVFERRRRVEAEALDQAFAALAPPPPITRLRPLHGRLEHVSKVREILALIEAGDVYQANLTFPLSFHYAGDALALYAALRTAQPVAHGGLLAFDDQLLMSVSPELFIEVAAGVATVRPMKGTAPRGGDRGADLAARDALAVDPKQRAENLMIVDLLRNDLARIGEPGTVLTSALFTAETYPTFHALTSTVTARLNPGVSLWERFAAMFPCGSIVGAPKIRAAEVIRQLEAVPRHVYTGAFGAIEPSGDMKFSVAIRTATVNAKGEGTYGVGGGIVADSDPDAEYDEALLKGRVLSALADEFGLIETFRWSAIDGFIRLDRHLHRLSASARALGFVFEQACTEAELDRAARAWAPSSGDRRVRVGLSRDGRLSITDEAAPKPSTRMLRVALADARLDAADPFLRHKTTRRSLYDAAYSQAEAMGCHEGLLLNRRNEVADAARHTVFLERGGRLVTPPVGAGALPGVLRASLIAEGRAVEGRIVPQDLGAASLWYLGNSLNGLRRGRLD